MKKLKMPYAITSLAFNSNSDLLAASSYSENKIDIYSIQSDEKIKSIALTNCYNPENSILWIEDTIVCIDDNAKKISFIDYQKGSLVNEFSHLHARGFESIDHIKIEDKDYILASGKKIHPPTIEKLGLSIDHKNLSNLFLIDMKGNLICSGSIKGNILKSKFIDTQFEKNLIIVISRNIEGTFSYLLNLDFDMLKENKLTAFSATNAFIASNLFTVSLALQLKNEINPTLFVKYDATNLEIVSKENFVNSKYFKNKDGYINSVFSSGSLSVIETFIKNENSLLEIIDDESKYTKDEFEVYGFMESVAFGKNLIAWSENNYINLVNI